MTRRIGTLTGILIALTLVLIAQHAKAQTIPLSINGAAKCAAARVGDAFTGVVDRSCGVIPPPPIDPDAYKLGTVTYQDGGAVRNVDLTLMQNVYGRASATQPIKGWAFASGSRPKITLPPTKHFNYAFSLVADSTGTTGTLAGSSYGSTNRPVYVQVLEDGVSIFYRDHDARNRPLLFNEQPWIYLVRNTPRTESKCPVRAGHVYNLIIGYTDRGGGTMVTQWSAN